MSHNSIQRSICQLALIIFGVCLVAGLSRELLGLLKKGDRIKELEKTDKELQIKKRKLKEKLKYVKSEEFVEKMVRDRLNMAKENETIIVLPADKLSELQRDIKKLPPKDLQNWQKWQKLFF